jgi:hypothetical protein
VAFISFSAWAQRWPYLRFQHASHHPHNARSPNSALRDSGFFLRLAEPLSFAGGGAPGFWSQFAASATTHSCAIVPKSDADVQGVRQLSSSGQYHAVQKAIEDPSAR